MERLCLLAGIMARGEVPVRVEPAIRLGRMTALQKPDGGIRGTVVGDVFRRLIARTMAQQIADAGTAPFQYALKTKGGCECVAHILQAVTDSDERPRVYLLMVWTHPNFPWPAVSFLVGGRSWRGSPEPPGRRWRADGSPDALVVQPC